MKKNIDLYICFALSLGSFVFLKFPIPAIGPFIFYLSVILLQGWLLNKIVFLKFDEFHPVLQIILIYMVGSILIGFELWILIGLRFQIDQNSIVIFGNLVSMILQMVLLGKRSFLGQDQNRYNTLYGLCPLAASAGVAVAFCILVWFSIPSKQERFSEFYIQKEDNNPSLHEGSIFIENHEGGSRSYVLSCSDMTTSSELIEVPLPDYGTAQIYYRIVAPTLQSDQKLEISLSLSKSSAPYRTIEVSGTNCTNFQIVNIKVTSAHQ